jgi:hypothetical protein
VVLIVGSREEVGLLTVVNSHEAISPVLRIFRALPTLIFLDNECTVFKHSVNFVNNIDTRILFVVLEIFNNNYFNIVV